MAGFLKKNEVWAPSEWKHFEDLHLGHSILILGCGPSLELLPKDYKGATFGVNDVAKWYVPDYLLCVNDRNTFSQYRWNIIYNTPAQNIFTHLRPMRIGFKHKDRVIKVSLGRRGGAEWDKNEVDYSVDSPYMAILMAARMGFKRIGLLGVDLTDANHNLSKRYAEVHSNYNKLNKTLSKGGIELFNLSPDSSLNLTKMNLSDWIEQNGQRGLSWDISVKRFIDLDQE